MSSHEPVPEPDSLFLTPRQRRQPVEFADDPTDDELANHWTLTEADQDLVFRSRGEASRRWCALQLCVLRKHGRFLDDLDSVPPRILSYLNRQLGLDRRFLSLPSTKTQRPTRPAVFGSTWGMVFMTPSPKRSLSAGSLLKRPGAFRMSSCSDGRSPL